ncbi:jg26233 [Pararge aegeria aegeria]|uniref:Jg26233 protein n=1 Tax=Pararge aegeria aegeria TaxID=348720 RepID=A0A8S4QET1_9NEOP|nr:jg26233 [Pararge aegeria aegeria]
MCSVESKFVKNSGLRDTDDAVTAVAVLISVRRGAPPAGWRAAPTHLAAARIPLDGSFSTVAIGCTASANTHKSCVTAEGMTETEDFRVRSGFLAA